MNISRRTAIKKGALGASGLLLGASLLKGNAFSEDKKLGVALVGLGRYSTLQLAPALQETEHCRLVGIVTGTPEKEKEWIEKYDIPKKNIYNYKNFDKIKRNPDIDIVYVVLPNFMHAEFTIRGLEAGKHVICEKPMAMSSEECIEMMAAAKKAKRKLGVGYRLYYEPHHLEARKLGTEKTFGKINMMETSLGFSMANPKSWRLHKKTGGWGALGDLGLYAIQGCRRVIGALPTKVSAQGYIFNKAVFKDTFETVMWQMEFPNGTVTNSTTSYSTYVDRLYASAEKGWIRLQPSFNAVGTGGETQKGYMMFKSKPYQQIDQLDAFAASILKEEPLEATAEEGLIDVKIIEAVYQAILSGDAINLKW